MNGDFDGSLGQPQIDSRLGVRRSGRVAGQVDLQGLELRQLAGSRVLVAQSAERPVEERQGPPPLEDPFGGLGMARLALVAGFPFAEIDGQRPLAAAPLLGLGLRPLLAGKPAGSREQKRSKTPAVGIGVGEVAFFEERRKKFLREVLRLFSRMAAAAEEHVDWIPIGGAQIGQCRPRLFARLTGRSDEAPLRGVKLRIARGSAGHLREYNPVCLVPKLLLGRRITVYGLQKTKELGFDTVDIFVDPLDIDIRERRLIKNECDRLELPIVSIACVAVGLVDFNPSVQRFHVERVQKYLDLAYEYEAKNVLLVLGEYIWNQEVIPPAEQWRTGVENCRRLGDYAAKLGVQIALELEPFKLSLVNSVDTMVRFLDDCDHPAVRANIDISHLVLAGVEPAELRRLAGKAIHVHISDCDGKKHGDLPPGRGVVPFAPYLDEIKKLAIDGAISIELEYSPEPDKITQWVAEAYAATDKLMREAGLRG